MNLPAPTAPERIAAPNRKPPRTSSGCKWAKMSPPLFNFVEAKEKLTVGHYIYSHKPVLSLTMRPYWEILATGICCM